VCKIKVEADNHKLNGLWLWDYSYSLHEDVFSEDIKSDIKENTGLNQGSLGDWWVFDLNPNPIYTWPELINLALNILHCKATKMFVDSLYLEEIPKYSLENYLNELPCTSFSGAKRINADSGDYTDYSEIVGINALKNMLTGREPKPKNVKMGKDKIRLSGKDESCCVEGSWLDWCMFACNILANKNTEIFAPELYAPTMKNDNY